MADPKNPYRPYTCDAAELDRAYDAAREAQKRRDDYFYEVMTQPIPWEKAQHPIGGASTPVRAGSRQDAGSFWLAGKVVLWIGMAAVAALIFLWQQLDDPSVEVVLP